MKVIYVIFDRLLSEKVNAKISKVILTLAVLYFSLHILQTILR